MEGFDADQLAAWAGGRWVGRPQAAVTGFTIDTRRAGAGDCFVALKTAQRDGHDFLEAAREQGCAAALVDEARAVDLPQLVVADPAVALRRIAAGWRERFAEARPDGVVIGITGSCGKTSTKDLLKRLLGEAETLATEANLNNTLGVPLTLLRIDSARHRFAVVEAGINQPGEMRLLGEMIRPDLAIVTMIGPAHLERLGSLEGIAREKSELPRALRSGGWLLGSAQAYEFAALREVAAPAAIALPAEEVPPAGAAVHLRYRLEPRAGGQRLWIETANGQRHNFELPPLSPGMCANAVLALGTALRIGIPADALADRLGGWQPSSQRGEWQTLAERRYYLDCYNSNPASLADAATAFDAATPSGARTWVIGSMEELGEQAARLHRETVAALPFRPEDTCIFIGSQAAALAEGARAAATPPAHIHTRENAAAARDRLVQPPNPAFLKASRRYRLESLLPDKLA